MNYCERCNGYGYLYLRGDNDFECPDCHGTGEIKIIRPPFHYETPADIVRICHYGLQEMAGITEAQYQEALSQLPPAPVTCYRVVDSEAGDREVEEAMEYRERIRLDDEDRLGGR